MVIRVMVPRAWPVLCGSVQAQLSWVEQSGKSQATHLRQGNWTFGSFFVLPSWLHSLEVPFGPYWISSLPSDRAAAALPQPCKCSPLAFKYKMNISLHHSSLS